MIFNFKEMTDDQLVSFGTMFYNGADWGDPEDQKVYEAMTEEVFKRGEDIQHKFAQMEQVI
jgi:hypothetical protein